ncbi:hypothetical protein CVT26_004010 [Gymnopilus dilepis]|uniref:Uncharacterized protein n=1 Tax=Gymnopilus dilepis TaxID=231916 RepID=A0A409X7N5_9AGAR|nr:hypothetical protein CVT26_004010 [Gymnopilus dilepis]
MPHSVLQTSDVGASAMTAVLQASTLSLQIARGSSYDLSLSSRTSWEQGAAEHNPQHTTHTLSAWDNKPRVGGGNSNSSGNNTSWAKEGRTASSSSLFNAKKVGSVLATKHRWQKRVVTTTSARLLE